MPLILATTKEIEKVCFTLSIDFTTDFATHATDKTFALSTDSTNSLFCVVPQVGSRRVVLVAGLLMAIFGCLGKFSALVVSMPDPIIGASFLVLFGRYIYLILLLLPG